MKNPILFLFLLYLTTGLLAQQGQVIQTAQGSYSAEPVVQAPEFDKTPCLSASQRSAVKSQIAFNRAKLVDAGILPAKNTLPRMALQLDFPLKTKAGFTDPGFHVISNYVDHDPNYPNQLRDPHCGNITYDRPSGYNHDGTDIVSWPFPLLKMDADIVEVIASEAGTILYKLDGNYDRNCGFNSNDWNAIVLEHADGSQTWYGHLKKNSLTTKTLGASISKGEILGVVGSSGSSTTPHLHMEVYDPDDKLIDPYMGTCNSLNTVSWWANQEPYKERRLNHIATAEHEPIMGDCPNAEKPFEQDFFQQGDTIFLPIYLIGLDNNDEVKVRILRPNGSVWNNWDWNSPWQFYEAAFVYWWVQPNLSQPSGQWTYEITYDNQTYSHPFNLGVTSSLEEELATKQFQLQPNPATDKVWLSANELKGAEAELQLYDATQRLVKTTMVPLRAGKLSYEWSLSDLPAGIYFVKLNDSQHQLTRKLILTR